jgi:uncharacterized Tic20 family protein
MTDQTSEMPPNPQRDANAPTSADGPLHPFDAHGEAGKETNRDACMWAMLCHLAGLAGLLPVLPAIGSIIGPLIVWMVKKDEFPLVNDQGKEALNFQITMFIYGVGAGLLIFTCIGIVLLPLVAIVDIVFIVIASIKANDGYPYRYPYPLIFRFIK